MNFENLNYLVVGAGFFGAVIAERIANDLNERVAVLDKRGHLGGNSHSAIDPASQIEIHTYGSHIFHTNNLAVWQYINRFSLFNNYRHKVLSTHLDRVFPMPINLETINSFYGIKLNPWEAKDFLAREAAKSNIINAKNLEERAIQQIGKPLYEAFIKGYTLKQWGVEPTTLPSSIIDRLPVRTNYNGAYFDDEWQGIPSEGYGKLFEKILKHRNIDVYLNSDYFVLQDKIPKKCLIIYTGPIDRYFNYKYGALGWRSLDFQKETISRTDYQGTAVMNYADASVPHTRIHEFKHYHPERAAYHMPTTVIFREYSKTAVKGEDPYYPMNLDSDKERLGLYKKEADGLESIIFGGRLGSYKYYDMHQVIASALVKYEKMIKPRLPKKNYVESSSKAF